MEHLYTATVTAVGGRNGKVVSSDQVIDLEVKTPKELGGAGGHATNPEQLFAAGYAACFDSALNLVARTQKVKVGTTEVTAHISIGKGTDGGFQLEAVLEVKVPDVSKEQAEQLVRQAHQVCPYSRATRGNMKVELKLV